MILQSKHLNGSKVVWFVLYCQTDNYLHFMVQKLRFLSEKTEWFKVKCSRKTVISEQQAKIGGEKVPLDFPQDTCLAVNLALEARNHNSLSQILNHFRLTGLIRK